MDDTALVRERHVAAHEDVVGDCLAEDFDAEGICYSGEYGYQRLKQTRSKRHYVLMMVVVVVGGRHSHLLTLPLEIRMHDRNAIVAFHHIPQRTEPFLDAHDLDLIRYRVPQVLQLLIGRAGRDQKTPSVAGGQAADDARAGDGAVADGDDVLELGLEDAVEVFGCAQGDEGVGVCEGCEDADSVWGGGQSLAGFVESLSSVLLFCNGEFAGTYSFEFSNAARTAMIAVRVVKCVVLACLSCW